MAMSINREARRAVEATVVERARSLVVEQAIALGMIAGIVAVVVTFTGEAGPTPARAGEAERGWDAGSRTGEGPIGRNTRQRWEDGTVHPPVLREGGRLVGR